MKGESESDPGEMSDTSVECERREIVKSRTDVDRQTGWADRQTDSRKEGEKTQSPASMIQLMSHIQVKKIDIIFCEFSWLLPDNIFLVLTAALGPGIFSNSPIILK